MPSASRRAFLALGALIAAGLVGCTRALTPRSAPTDRPTSSGARSVARSDTAASTTATPPGTTATSTIPPPQANEDVSSSRGVRPSAATPPTSTRRGATTSVLPPPSGPAVEVAHGPRNRRAVALTFHGAGDIALAHRILAIAQGKRAALTVMAVGTWLVDNPDIGRQILAAGHQIGNHTYSHVDINSLPADQMRAEVIRCRAALLETTGTPGSYFRQSQSQTAVESLKQIAGEAGYAVCLSYDVDSMDWTDPGPVAIRNNLSSVAPGSIVSMHLGHAGTAQALPGVLDDLARRGLAAVTVGTLLDG